MVASARTFDALRTIGLNKYERNLWVALLSRGASTAGELSDISNVPRSRCYDVLESLSVRGFVVIQPGKPLKYVTVPPKEAMDRAKRKVVEDAAELSDRIDRLVKSDTIKELERVHKDSIKTVRPEDLTGALKGRYAMQQQIDAMLKKAKKSVKLITTATGLSELVEHHGALLKKASESGVKIQIAAPINKQTVDVARELGKYAQVRNIEDVEHVESMAGRVCLIDGNEFMMGLTDDAKVHPTQDVAFWSQSDHATTGVIEPMFELVWKNSRPVK